MEITYYAVMIRRLAQHGGYRAYGLEYIQNADLLQFHTVFLHDTNQAGIAFRDRGQLGFFISQFKCLCQRVIIKKNIYAPVAKFFFERPEGLA